jgi:NitT/TauT family transport system substrate-binding protein
MGTMIDGKLSGVRQSSPLRTRRQLLRGVLSLAAGSAALGLACGSGGNKSNSAAQRATAAAGGSAAFSGPPAKLTASVGAADPSYMVPFIARDAGIFQRNGIDITIQVIPGPMALAALISGQIQVATAGGGETIGAATGGADLQIVAAPSPTFAGNIYAAPNIKTPADLKGKKVAITSPGGTYDILFRAALPKMGLEPDKDVTLIATGSITNTAAALLNGAVSAAPSSIGPTSIKFEAAGFHPIFQGADVPFASASTVMQHNWENANRAVAQRYVDSIVQGIVRMKHDKPFAIQTMKKFTDSTDEQALGVAWDFFSQDKITPSLPYPKTDFYQINLSEIIKKNAAAQSFDLNKLIDPSLVQSAADRHLEQ